MLASQLRVHILDGSIADGAALPAERDLVVQTGLSRGSVREALRILHTEGLITTRPGRLGGSVARRPGDDALARYVGLFVQGRGISLMSLLQVREAIEPSIASLAAANRTKEDLAELTATTQRLEDAFANVPLYLAENVNWHVAVAAASHNELLKAFLTAISSLIFKASAIENFATEEVRSAGHQGAPAHPGCDRRTRRRCRQPPDGAPPGGAHQANARIRAGTGRSSLKENVMAIEFEVQDSIALITLNRPERMNALDAEHYDALSRAWQTVRDDPTIRVAVVTGAGEKSFCSGADLKSFIAHPPSLAEMMLTQKSQLLNRGLELWKPVIAAVNGYCLGGGMTMLLATDLRVAAEHATFSVAEVKRGVFPANGGTQRIIQQLPHAIAMQMLLIGDAIDAATALRWGLVNKVVPRSELLPAAMDYAKRLSANAPLAVQSAKELALRSRDMDLASGLRMEQLFLRLLQTSDDVQEGATAFSEKRPPQFKGL